MAVVCGESLNSSENTDRIIALADDHQVIVFTHNIWFAAELLSKADKKKWKYYDIRLEAGDAGVVSAASHPRVDEDAAFVAEPAVAVELGVTEEG